MDYYIVTIYHVCIITQGNDLRKRKINTYYCAQKAPFQNVKGRFESSFRDRAAGEVHVFVEGAHAVDYAVVGDLDYAVCDGLRELMVVA